MRNRVIALLLAAMPVISLAKAPDHNDLFRVSLINDGWKCLVEMGVNTQVLCMRTTKLHEIEHYMRKLSTHRYRFGAHNENTATMMIPHTGYAYTMCNLSGCIGSTKWGESLEFERTDSYHGNLISKAMEHREIL